MRSLARHWLSPWLRGLRALQARPARAIDVAVPSGGRIESIRRTADGLIAAHGWTPDLEAFAQALRLRIAADSRPPTHVFRVPQPARGAADAEGSWLGAVAEWAIEPCDAPRTATMLVHDREVATLSLSPSEETPYAHLHTWTGVLGRADIYASGLPTRAVSAEVLSLARRLPGPVLDFGCGAGALVAALRREGIDAYGLEIDDARIREHLIEEVKPYVTLYSGAFPAPFASAQFAGVVCSEVLEHTPGPQATLAEVARLAGRAMLITVPDMSAIPRGYAHAVVPWHLLESTHVNFFTQASLHAALEPHAARIEMARIGVVQCDRLQFYSSLAAVVERAR